MAKRDRTSQKQLLEAKSESTPTEAEYGVPLTLVDVGVLRLDKWFNLLSNPPSASSAIPIYPYKMNEHKQKFRYINSEIKFYSII